MAKCEICDKGQHFGIQISHSHRRSNRAWKPNIRRAKMTINGVTKECMCAQTACVRLKRPFSFFTENI